MVKQIQLTATQMQMAKALAPEAVRQQVLNRPLTQVGLSLVYQVLPNWEAEELMRADGVVNIDSAEALAAILEQDDDDNEQALLVRRKACKTLEDLKALLIHISCPRIIFYEME